MFAIVDIETCGGKFEFRKGRITEICVLKHDGLSVVDKFTTLVNPECYISPYFTGLTGITNDMVADAPKFHEIASRIIEITKGCVFVAHNVGFDYNFVREEFNSLGYKFKRETLCTVRLSRKLIPGRISYSLGHLCASLGIEIFGRHRAEGDAVATAQLFDLLIQLKNQDSRYKNTGVTELMTRKVDKIRNYVLDKLPEECGVYYFLNKDKEIIYIGKSSNMYRRAQGHFNSDKSKGRKMLFEMVDTDYVVTGSELVALLLESEEIKSHRPKYNRARKASEFTHCIDCFTDKQGIINFEIRTAEESDDPLVSFPSYASARSCLDGWIDEHSLCLRYCNLTGSDAVCFNHQIKTCGGICAGEEDIGVYNNRAEKLVKNYRFPNSDFIILDKGRNPGEYAMVFVEKQHYYGYGFFDGNAQISTPEDLKDLVKKAQYYPDADMLIRSFLNSGTRQIISLPKQREEHPW